MIDIHCHLLPGIDDGPRSWDAALDVCRALVDEGVSRAIATPHVVQGVWDNGPERVAPLIAELRRRLDDGGVPLAVAAGGEVAVSDPRLLARPDALPSLAGTAAMLIELPVALVPHAFDGLLFTMRTRGRTPVIAHPERCVAVQKDPAVAGRWHAAGALLQIDAESIVGLFGPDARRAARALVLGGFASALASDSHSTRRRPPRLAAAVREVTSLAGPEVARFLVEDGPARILEGRPVGEPPAPLPARTSFVSRLGRRTAQLFGRPAY